MERSIEFLFAKPVNETYFEFGINSVDRARWISRDDLRNFISDNVSQDIISIKDISELVDRYRSFVIDLVNKEWYELEFDCNQNDITNIRDHRIKEPNKFDRIIEKVKQFKLNINNND